MVFDPWQQWQSFAATSGPARAASQAVEGRHATSPFAHFTDIAEHFARAAHAYLEAIKSTPMGAADAARIFTESLRELFAEIQPASFGMGAAAGGSVPYGFTHDSPALGATREHQQRWQRTAHAWRRLEEAQRRLQRLGSDVLRDAAETFAVGLAKSQPGASSPEALRKLYADWIDSAEDAYSRVAHGESFCNTLAECVNASSDWRRELQASLEHAAKFLDVPTRSELNTLTQRVKSLEEDLRRLREPRKPKAATYKTRRTKRKARS